MLQHSTKRIYRFATKSYCIAIRCFFPHVLLISFRIAGVHSMQKQRKEKCSLFPSTNTQVSQVLITNVVLAIYIVPKHLLLFPTLVSQMKNTKEMRAHEFVVFHLAPATAFASAVWHIVYGKYIYGRKLLESEANWKIETHKLAYKINRLLITIF